MHHRLSLPPGQAALVLIDMQEEHRSDPRYLVHGYDTVVANCARLLAAARARGMPVLHSVYLVDTAADATRPFHPKDRDGRSAFSDAGSPEAEISPELAPPQETVIVKRDARCVTSPDLAGAMARQGIDWLIVCGCWSEASVAAIVKDGVERGACPAGQGCLRFRQPGHARNRRPENGQPALRRRRRGHRPRAVADRRRDGAAVRSFTTLPSLAGPRWCCWSGRN